MSQLKLNTN